MFETCEAEAVGLDSLRWQATLDLAESWCQAGEVPAIGLFVARGTRTTGVHLFGRQKVDDPHGTIAEDAIFLVASITKPLVALGALLLVERGELRLGDRVGRFVPEFRQKGKNAITIRHLLTHTSGLPDMLPDNRTLREAGAGLEAFVEGTCQARPDFSPGSGVQYQSMGFAMLGEVIARVSGVDCPTWLREQLFEPLGLVDTRLGAPAEWFEGQPARVDRIAEIRLLDEQVGQAWSWNERYWRMLGTPWGGLLTTPAELGRLGRLMLEGGGGILSPASIAAATRNQLAAMPDVPESMRRGRPWGLGWRLDWPATSANFGDLLGPATFGHWGATGTVLWIDPEHETVCVILTTQPQEPAGSWISRLSNAVAASLL